MSTLPSSEETISPELAHVRSIWSRSKNNSAIYKLLLSEVSLVDASPGQIRARLPLTTEHVNSRGGIHGAVSAAIVDWSGGMSIATHGFEKTGASVDIHISYQSTAKVGDEIEIVATATKVGRSLAFTSIVISKVVDGVAGPIVATGSHTKFLPVSPEHRRPKD